MTPLRQRAQNLLTTKAETWRDRLAHVDALPQLTLLGLLTGVLAGLVIVLFRLLIDLPLGLLLPKHSENFEALAHWARFALPFTGACLLGLVLTKVAQQYHAAAGLVTALFASSLIRLQRLSCRLSLERPIWLRFLAAGLVTGSLALAVPEIMGVGYDTIESAFSGNLTVTLLLLVLMAKLIATAVTLGVGMPGGVVGPCLVMGACVGGIVGIIAQDHLPLATSDPRFYMVLGMGAMMGAVLNAPIAAMMAILELTHNPHLIFPSMLMVVTACLTTRWAFRCDGLFQTLLRIQGKYNEPEWRQQIMSRSGVRSLLDRNIRVCDPQPNILDLTHHLRSQPHWLILKRADVMVNATDVQHYLASQEQQDHLPEQVDLLEIPARRLQITPLPDHANLYEAWQQLKQSRADAVYVVGKGNTIIGVITRDLVENF